MNNHGYEGNLINCILDLTDKGIGVRQSFLKGTLQVGWMNFNIDEEKN